MYVYFWLGVEPKDQSLHKAFKNIILRCTKSNSLITLNGTFLLNGSQFFISTATEKNFYGHLLRIVAF